MVVTVWPQHESRFAIRFGSQWQSVAVVPQGARQSDLLVLRQRFSNHIHYIMLIFGGSQLGDVIRSNS